MKALDIVKTPKGGIAFVTETNSEGKSASITFISGLNIGHEHNSWWDESELIVIDSIPRMLAISMCHPMGEGRDDANKFFGLTTK